VGKPFEIVYSPANWTAPAGGVATSWSSPYGGLNVQTPPNLISPAQTPATLNFMFRNAELRTRPQFKAYLPSPDGNQILGVGSFLSRNNVWHTVCWTVNGMFQLRVGIQNLLAQGQNPWSLVGGPAMAPATFVRWRVFQSILYYTNNNGHVSAWDGAALTPVNDIAFLGAGVSGLPPSTTTLIGAQFIGELDNHLILASTSETPIVAGVQGGTGAFPQRVRWSNSGFNPFGAGAFGSNLGTQGATFDPSVFPSAGSADFLDVPDLITGLMFLGRVGYIFRQNGITEVSPTGNGTAPFDFNHLWASEQGIGNVYAASIAQYGDMGIFVSTENIYKISGSALTPIGAGARDAIFADLATTTQPPTGVIVPALTLGYTYYVYMLFILTPSGATKCWVYSLEDNNWAPWQMSDVTVGIPYKCWIGDTPISVLTQLIVNSTQHSGGGLPGGGGGRFCFTPNTLVLTDDGWRPIASIVVGDRVETLTGFRRVSKTMVHEYKGLLHHMGNDEWVTFEHMISKDGEEWVMAGKVFEQTGGYEGLVYNLEVEAEDYIGHSYRLNNGWFAHNLKPFQG
jgi:hypothetical protein